MPLSNLGGFIMKGLTYAERLLLEGGINQAIIAGFNNQDYAQAMACFRAFRVEHGYADAAAKVLTAPESQPKLGKSDLPAYGLMLTPERGLGKVNGKPVNLCPLASKGCAAACLSKAGKGEMSSVQKAREVRTRFMLEHPWFFGILLGVEVRRALVKHEDGIALRLNVTSDIRWELVAGGAMNLMSDSGVTLYDYTAWTPADRVGIMSPFFTAKYDLTYSAKEPEATPDLYLAQLLSGGHNVAMPFNVKKGRALPDYVILAGQGFDVIDGDLSDDRTLDRKGVVVGLRVKGRVKDSTGFIREVSPSLTTGA